MQITDTIADMLTRIRNANSAKHDSVDIPASNMKKAIAQILVDEDMSRNYQVIEDGKQGRDPHCAEVPGTVKVPGSAGPAPRVEARPAHLFEQRGHAEGTQGHRHGHRFHI